jgi:hypothetical protein
MSERRLATLAFTIVGLCFATWGLIKTADASYWLFVREGTEASVVFATLLPGPLGLAAGALIWRRAEALASRCSAAGGVGETQGALHSEAPLALALFVIGVLLLVQAVPDLARSGTLLYLTRQGPLSAMDYSDTRLFNMRLWNGHAKGEAVAAAVRLLIGLAFLLGPPRLAAALTRVRQELRGSLTEEASDETPQAAEKPLDA